jgi:hypothetical protein
MELYSGDTGGRITMPDYKRLPVPMIWGEAAIFLKAEEGESLWKALEHTPLSYANEHVVTFHRSLAHWLDCERGPGTCIALHDGRDVFKKGLTS